MRWRRSADTSARNPNPYQRVCQAWRSAFQVLVVVSSIWQPDRLEKGRSGAHIQRMETIVKCDCGAEYKRTEAKFLMPHTGHVSCEVCGPYWNLGWKAPTLPHSSWSNVQTESRYEPIPSALGTPTRSQNQFTDGTTACNSRTHQRVPRVTGGVFNERGRQLRRPYSFSGP